MELVGRRSERDALERALDRAAGAHLELLDAIAGPSIDDTVDPLTVASALSEVLRSPAQS